MQQQAVLPPQVMQTLKDLCQEGHTVISSIHQPRSSIFAMFDDLILLSEGRMLYSGPAAQALSYFEQLGHKCPQHYNPAEFLADIISVDASTPEVQQKTRRASDGYCNILQLGQDGRASIAWDGSKSSF